MTRQRLSEAILYGCMGLMIVGFVLHLQAQVPDPLTPAGMFAVLGARLDGFNTRLEGIESTQRYAMMAIFGSLVAHVLQLRRGK